VRQILSNLIGNALKYTDAGGVTLSAGVRADERGRAWAVVDVADTGPGVPDEARHIIFDEFRRLDVSNGRKGTGVGLAISARLAAALGGRITVASAIGHGSVFSLWLPVSGAATVNLWQAAADPSPGLHQRSPASPAFCERSPS
jgi:two-component system, NarL family, capsular synthesis sensor histidine kinase RcsC